MSRSYDIYELYARRTRDGGFETLEKFYQDYEITPLKVHWNTGLGYLNTDAYILKYSETVSVGGTTAYAGAYYYGVGRPNEITVAGKKKITELLGYVGRVDTSANSYSQVSSNPPDYIVGEVKKWASITEFERRYSSADSSMGGVYSANTASLTSYSNPYNGSSFLTSSISAKGLPSGYGSYKGGYVGAFPRSGYGFVKWTVGGVEVTATSGPVHVEAFNGESMKRKLVISPTSASEYNAVAYFAPAFTVSFAANAPAGATVTGTMSDQSFTNGVSQNLTSNAFAVAGYIFDGWNTAADGSGTDIADGADGSGLSSTPGGNVTLYAQWHDARINVSVVMPPSAPDQTQPVATITPAATGGTWAAGTVVTVSVPPSGVGIVFADWESTVVGTSGTAANGDKTYTFTMPNAAVTIVANYSLRSIDISDHAVDEDSGAAVAQGDATSVTDMDGEALIAPPVYGDKVRFVAPVPLTGYSFSGWYSGGSLVWSERVYPVELTEDTHLRARYATAVTVTKDTSASTAANPVDGYFMVNGTAYVKDGSVTVTRELGSMLAIKAVPAEGSYFNGWKIDGDLDGSLLAETSVKVDTSHTYTAVFGELVYAEVTCKSRKNAGNEDGNVGVLTITGTLKEVESPATNPVATTETTTVTIDGQTHSYNSTKNIYTVFGFTGITLIATPAAENPLPLFRIVEVVDDEERVLSSTSPVQNSVAQTDRTFIARWGYPSQYTVTVSSADANMGAACIGGDANVVSKTALQDSTVVVSALPLNGYKFKYWERYDEVGGEWEVLEGASPKYEIKMLSASWTLRAVFEQDAFAICEWEGSDEPKTMEWTSKVYVTAKPFDPVAARVDATGYPVDLTVRTYSSPDKAEPTALPDRLHPLTAANPFPIQSQDGRRLPRMRPERYVQITVRASHEIDAVVVGTNMTEVN